MNKLIVTLTLLQMTTMVAQSAEPTISVLTYHGSQDRRGNFVVPTLAWERARSLHVDESFRGQFRGDVYAQPLYWYRSGMQSGMLLIATEDNTVYALDAKTGTTVWRKALGAPVPLRSLPCGNIDPLGVTGTPVISAENDAIYLDAMILDQRSSTAMHELFALSLQDGSVLPGWPIDVAGALKDQGITFDGRSQNQRGALTVVNDILYVPYGGHFGDCARYHGWVVGVKLANPRAVTSWHTRGRGGGIWAPAGISSDGDSLFVVTGNTINERMWADGEAVIRLSLSLEFSGKPADFFAPSDWRQLDDRDADLGGVGPVLFDLTESDGESALAIALGKDGKAYLLDRHHLGGLGGSIVAKQVSPRSIRTAATVYPATGSAFIAFQGPGTDCPAGGTRAELTVLQVRVGKPPSIATAWCGSLHGAGAPIVTTTDGQSNPIVWILGAEGDNRLYGFRGDTGERLFASAALSGLHHFQTLIATQDRLYVAGNGSVYAFAF
jgi:outer membrane protein assembly factor BamB